MELGGHYGILRMEPGLPVYKSRPLPIVLFLQPSPIDNLNERKRLIPEDESHVDFLVNQEAQILGHYGPSRGMRGYSVSVRKSKFCLRAVELVHFFPHSIKAIYIHMCTNVYIDF